MSAPCFSLSAREAITLKGISLRGANSRSPMVRHLFATGADSRAPTFLEGVRPRSHNEVDDDHIAELPRSRLDGHVVTVAANGIADTRDRDRITLVDHVVVDLK